MEVDSGHPSTSTMVPFSVVLSKVQSLKTRLANKTLLDLNREQSPLRKNDNKVWLLPHEKDAFSFSRAREVCLGSRLRVKTVDALRFFCRRADRQVPWDDDSGHGTDESTDAENQSVSFCRTVDDDLEVVVNRIENAVANAPSTSARIEVFPHLSSPQRARIL